MILAEVKLTNLWDNEYDSNHAEMRDYCRQHFGPMAQERDQVGREFPWTFRNLFSHDMWYFAEEEHAVLFTLRWA